MAVKQITIEIDVGLDSQEDAENFFWHIVQAGMLNADRAYTKLWWPAAVAGDISLIRATPKAAATPTCDKDPA